MLITPEYRELNRQLHADRPDYGTGGHKFAETINQMCAAHRTTDVLDYGCGKRTLEKALGFSIQNYDPAVEGLETVKPADIMCCTDVLEHIEPECLTAVLQELRTCTKIVAFLTIATRPAKKTLADGRNAHLIQKNGRWWIEALWNAGFELHQFIDVGGEELQVIAK